MQKGQAKIERSCDKIANANFATRSKWNRDDRYYQNRYYPLAKCYLGRIVSRKHERDLRGDPPIVLPITEINAVDSAVVARHIGFMTSRNGCVPISGVFVKSSRCRGKLH